MAQITFIGEVEVAETRDLKFIGNLMEFAEEIEGVSTFFDLKTCKLRFTIQQAGSREVAPPGTHDFADGWMFHRTIFLLNARLKRDGIKWFYREDYNKDVKPFGEGWI